MSNFYYSILFHNIVNPKYYIILYVFYITIIWIDFQIIIADLTVKKNLMILGEMIFDEVTVAKMIIIFGELTVGKLTVRQILLSLLTTNKNINFTM
jgi:hypothetical protein